MKSNLAPPDLNKPDREQMTAHLVMLPEAANR